MKKDAKRYLPISENEFYFIQNHYNARFDYVLHYHSEFELNLVFGTSGRRIINNCVEKFQDIDLVLAGPRVLHSWKDNTKSYEKSNARVVTLQFHNDFLDKQTLNRYPLKSIEEMLRESYRGILFTVETAHKVKVRLIKLHAMKGFYAFIEFLSILYELSVSPGRRILSSATFAYEKIDQSEDRLSRIFNYIHHNYHQKIYAAKAALITNMSVSAFSHYFKKHTSMSFLNYLIEYRISKVLNQLANEEFTISEIAYHCGFTNIQNFNRLFKKKVGCTPLEYRKIGRSQSVDI